ncbi:hypothetical protein C8J56DRAFT_1025268 [Mycena floridula]|nr:hypothetical protein C8J56DRAFT_1025268 [Mycena floridula]
MHLPLVLLTAVSLATVSFGAAMPRRRTVLDLSPAGHSLDMERGTGVAHQPQADTIRLVPRHKAKEPKKFAASCSTCGQVFTELDEKSAARKAKNCHPERTNQAEELLQVAQNAADRRRRRGGQH